MKKTRVIRLELPRENILQLCSMMVGAFWLAQDQVTKNTADRVLNQLVEHLDNTDQLLVEKLNAEFEKISKTDTVSMSLMKTGVDGIFRDMKRNLEGDE